MAPLRVARVIIGQGRPGTKLEIGPSVVPLFKGIQNADLPAALAQDVATPFFLAVNVEYAVIIAKRMDDNGGLPTRKETVLNHVGGGGAPPHADEENDGEEAGSGDVPLAVGLITPPLPRVGGC